jgi:hypothetical protein
MQRFPSLASLLIGIGLISPAFAQPDAPKKRGAAVASETRPAHFPHRIWAACDFEAQTPDYAWFGPTETKNIPKYPGNVTALGVKEKPYRNFSALMTGINPVPGPVMGKLNKMYCRYYLKGGTEATFQHFSLSVNDNNHIRVSGLTEGKWSEVTLNFTRDAARNDGSAKAFQKGERMDDLKVLDDIIFFDDDPDMPVVKEPFPNRVIFQASFDTGIDPKSKPKYWPGEFEVLTKTKGAPDDSYWGVAKAVLHKETKGKWIRIEVKPHRAVGAHTKLRFRYHLTGASKMTAQMFDVTDNDNRHIHMKDLKEGAWQWAILDFTKAAKRNDGKETPFAAGHKVDDIFFFVRPEEDKEVQLYVDEVTLFDAGKDRREAKEKSSPLAKLAASMKAGEWAELKTENQIETLRAKGASGAIFGYNEDAVWDPKTRQFYYVGGDHNDAVRFVTYVEESNTWKVMPKPDWVGKGTSHGYSHHGFDAERGYLYYLPFGNQNRTVHRYDIAEKWTALPKLNPPEYLACCMGVEYFPELDGLVLANGGGGKGCVHMFQEKTQKWTTLARDLPMGIYHNTAQYSPTHKVILFGGGNGSSELYKLDAKGKVTTLKKTPIGLGVMQSILTVDPLSGDFLLFGKNGSFYVYDVAGDMWKEQDSTKIPIFSPTRVKDNKVWHVTATPVSTHGVTMFVKYFHADPPRAWVYLYKHSDGTKK